MGTEDRRDFLDTRIYYVNYNCFMKDFLFLGKPLQKGRSLPLLFVRVFIACMMLLHGGAKWMAFGELADNFPDPLGVSPVVSLVFSLLAEVGCSVLLLFGLFTRLSALPLIFNMIIAIWVIHGDDPFQMKELGILYLAFYILFFWIGGGRYSLDYVFFWKRKYRNG